MIKRIQAAMICATCFFASVADALEVFTEYRISGDEILNVIAPNPEIEAPFTLEIDLTNERRLLIESDQPIDDCLRTLQNGQANRENASVEIVVHKTANTMNGVVVIQCAVIFP